VLALLYDVHGNLPALEAVLADAGQAGATRWMLGGDYSLFGGWPDETLERLRALHGASWLRGNGERWTAHPGDAPDGEPVQGAIAACREALGAENVAELDALPERLTLLEGVFCHASPRSDVESFLPEPGKDDDRLLNGVQAARVIFGHTHLPFRRVRDDGVVLINPGSVGMPFDGDPRAAYALMDEEGNVEHRRVAYDHEASARHLTERFGAVPWTEVVTRRIATARP
jgi:diadenosine tetraphosphatase ApaH/serine/threonine PP2A family protein phosphatase